MNRIMLTCLVALVFISPLSWADGIAAWESLIPEAERSMLDMPAIDHQQTNVPAQQNLNVSLNTEINNTSIRIPGFVVPLEGDQERIREFLLVPYFGACMHYPPPPPNQIIYVRSDEGMVLEDLWQPVWVEGVITLDIQDVADVATTGYLIDQPKAISLYEE